MMEERPERPGQDGHDRDRPDLGHDVEDPRRCRERVRPSRLNEAVMAGRTGISAFAVDEQGYADGPTTIRSSGQTPYGFDFTAGETMIVTEAFGGAVGAERPPPTR
jgi:hypothetical protein